MREVRTPLLSARSADAAVRHAEHQRDAFLRPRSNMSTENSWKGQTHRDGADMQGWRRCLRRSPDRHRHHALLFFLFFSMVRRPPRKSRQMLSVRTASSLDEAHSGAWIGD